MFIVQYELGAIPEAMEHARLPASRILRRAERIAVNRMKQVGTVTVTHQDVLDAIAELTEYAWAR